MKNNEVVKFGLILFVITAVCTGIVSAMFEITNPIIEKQQIEKDNKARETILPAAKSFEKVEGDFGEEVKEVYKGLDGSEVVGYTIKTTPKGYGGEIEVTTAVTKDMTISGVSIGTMSETPGLGAKSKDEAFIGQYKDKAAKEIKVIKNGTPADDQIVAIAGATITSNAVTKGVNESIKVAEKQMK